MNVINDETYFGDVTERYVRLDDFTVAELLTYGRSNSITACHKLRNTAAFSQWYRNLLRACDEILFCAYIEISLVIVVGVAADTTEFCLKPGNCSSGCQMVCSFILTMKLVPAGAGEYGMTE